MSEQSLFSPRVLLLWVSALAAILALSLYLFAFGDGAPETRTVGPSAYSRSAIGYAGLAELLRRAGASVTSKRIGSVADEDADSLLILAEPEASARYEATGFDFGPARTVLVILPKWLGERDRRHPGWIGHVEAAPESDADWALSILGLGGRVERGGSDGRPFEAKLTINRLGVEPRLPDDLQLIVGSSLVPILATGAGVAIGQSVSRGRRIWVVADPDILSNHGLFEGANAQFAGALVEALRGPGGRVVFDEAIHGFAAPAGSPLRALFGFPFVAATLYGLAALAVVLWAAMGRFGAPEPAPVRLQAGKLGLIRNVADLIALAGGRRDVAMNYLRLSVDDAARRLRAPRGLGLESQMEWLDRVGAARGLKAGVADIARRLVGQRQDAALARAALDLHQWKQEILRGP